MATKATPKYRLSFSPSQISLLVTGLEALEAVSSPLSKSAEFYKTLENLRAYSEGERQASYVATGEAPGRKPAPAVTAESLGELATKAQAPSYNCQTIEECQRAYRAYLTIHKPLIPLGHTLPTDLAEAVEAWETYCFENDMDPVTEAEKGD